MPHESLHVLAAFAHPDDAELSVGGSLIRAADEGERVGVLDLTRGEGGSEGSAELRATEAEASAALMGLATRRNAGLPDAALRNTSEARSVVASIIRELRPRVVVTHWRDGRHPDHRAAAELVYDACFLAGLKSFSAAGEAFRPSKVLHTTSFREDAPKPTFVVDITAQIDRKLAAIACFASQFTDKMQAGEVFPGGSRPLEDQIRMQAAHYGSLIRTPFGEPFWSRETVELGSLSSASTPSTF